MTDARLPGRWLVSPAFRALSDKAWRCLTEALMYCNEAGTDGVLEEASYPLVRHSTDPATLDELKRAGLIIIGSTYLALPDWDTKLGQSTAEAVERQRAFNRDRQKRARERARSKAEAESVTRDKPRESLGQDRTGQESDQGKDEAEGRGVGEDYALIHADEIEQPEPPIQVWAA